MTYASASWSHTSASAGRKSPPSSYLQKHEVKGETVLLFSGKCSEECRPSAPLTRPGKEEGHGHTSCRGSGVWRGFFYPPPTHMCSTESVDEGLSFSSGGLWSNTMVSVLARQNPLDRMISKRDTEGGVGRRGQQDGLGEGGGVGVAKLPTGADLIS